MHLYSRCSEGNLGIREEQGRGWAGPAPALGLQASSTSPGLVTLAMVTPAS